RPPIVSTRDEVPQHRFGDLKVRDHPVAQWTNRLDVARGSPQHLFCLTAYSEHPIVSPRISRYGNDAGLTADDTFALDVDERRRGAEVNRQVVGKKTVKPVEDHGLLEDLCQIAEGTAIRERPLSTPWGGPAI